MRKLRAWLYVTLDGVVEAPENWVMPDDEMFEEQTADYAASDALLLGRRTYEVFAASWPERGSDVPNADWMNNTQKYVVSTTLESPEWQNTTVLKGEVSEALSRLKEEDGETIRSTEAPLCCARCSGQSSSTSCGSFCIRSCWDQDTGCLTTARIWVPSSSPNAMRMTTALSRSPTNLRSADAGVRPAFAPPRRARARLSISTSGVRL
jgi:hypothetical protein